MYRIAFLISSLFVSSTLLFSCAGKQEVETLPYYNTPDFTPEFFSSDELASTAVKHTIPAFSFTDQNGETISEKTVEGKIHVANFMFTRCASICPVMTNHMKMVQDSFGQNPNLVILSYSVTPWIDSLPRLREYANENSITSSNWHLLTGSQDKIYTLARKGYFAEEDLGYTRDSTDFLHTEHILLVDRSKRIRGIYNGTLQLEIEQMIKDIGTLLKE